MYAEERKVIGKIKNAVEKIIPGCFFTGTVPHYGLDDGCVEAEGDEYGGEIINFRVNLPEGTIAKWQKQDGE